MKALEKIKDMINFCDAIGCHRALYESLKAVEEELEALQQHRSCEGCKYNRTDEDFHSYVCDDCCRKSVDRYEAKGAMR